MTDETISDEARLQSGVSGAPCKGASLQWETNPTWQLSLQPVAIGAVAEVTKQPKPSVQKVAWRLGERAGRNASER